MSTQAGSDIHNSQLATRNPFIRYLRPYALRLEPYAFFAHNPSLFQLFKNKPAVRRRCALAPFVDQQGIDIQLHDFRMVGGHV